MAVGLTGGIATGKSTVSEMLRRRGARLIDADQIARAVVEPGQKGNEQVRRRFGERVFHPDGSLNRKALGEIVFRDKSARQDLNRILHPLIMKRMKEEKDHWEKIDPNQVVILDIPLLIEEDLTSLVDQVILVYVTESIQLKRLMNRDQINETEAKQKMAAQMPIEMKKTFADVVIDNSGSLTNTERQVDELWGKLISENGSNLP
ncbi:dephospho-CoA kinase [Kroppenstedtia pulmonis]|uniref:Dephospho-CoA kinase n=1 Tax=Kroppenstedtia pulmonis TaxID=1380685 RepID=A0A7D4BVG8_9BACL|nr:dephospho-CoA kinase [Kroppenstedtia pulmonis]QKG83973.1 dephospho-CoA kinase [Kroppenstedtia pulmonis]